MQNSVNATAGMPGDLVELKQMNGEAVPVTTSLKVAEYFEKNHRDVLRGIKETVAKCSVSFNERNFALVEYADAKGETRPMYLLTRDGFVMVAMGYTGEKAMRFKEAYINAFNEMQRQLASPVSQKVTKADVEMLDYFYTFVCEAKGNQRIRAIDRAVKSLSGHSPLELSQYALPDTPDDDLANYKTVTEIGKMFGVSAVKLNPILTGLGLQTAEQKYKKVKLEDGTPEENPDGFEYKPTALGEQHGGKRVSDSATNNVQKEVWSLKWHKDKLPAYLREVYFKQED